MLCSALKLQNGSAHEVGASYSGLYEEGEVKHINRGIGLYVRLSLLKYNNSTPNKVYPKVFTAIQQKAAKKPKDSKLHLFIKIWLH